LRSREIGEIDLPSAFGISNYPFADNPRSNPPKRLKFKLQKCQFQETQ